MLGRPYRLHGDDEAGMDCSTVAEFVLRGLGFNPSPLSPHRIKSSPGISGEIEHYFGQDEWRLVGRALSDACKEGDLLLTEPLTGRGRGLYALADAATNTFLTADQRHGVVAVQRAALYRLPQRVVGVYRCSRRSNA